ncbi:UNVERIFIED_CONTAM: hypothetical protein FKN15_043574 [Acipenser sinensis]
MGPNKTDGEKTTRDLFLRLFDDVGQGPTLDRKGKIAMSDQVHSKATRPIVPEDNTYLSGFYSRPEGALSATGVAGAR